MQEIVYIIFTIQAVVYVSFLFRILFVNTFTSVTCQSWCLGLSISGSGTVCDKCPFLVTSVCYTHLSHSSNNITYQSPSICNLTSFVSVRNFYHL